MARSPLPLVPGPIPSIIVTQLVTVTINGAEDTSVISGTMTGAVTEGDIGDPAVTATGTISISDVDDADSPTFADIGSTVGDNSYGSFILSSGTWTYTLDQSAVQDLDAGDSVTDTITYTASDSSTQQITITITGTSDSAVVSGTTTGAVTEGSIGDAPVTVSGIISISDADAVVPPSFADVASTAGDNGYGSFVLTSGTWTYTLDQSAVQDLDAGDTVNDTITYTASDSSTQQITVTITGTNDAAVISGTVTGAVTEGDIGDPAVTATGTISISDVDDADSPTFADIGSTVGDNSYGSFILSSGTWTYTLDQSAVQDLDAGDSVTDTITYTASDSSTQQITVTINGANDSPVVSNVNVAATEDGATVEGSFVVTDVDTSDNHTFTITSAPAVGSVVNNNDDTFTFDPGVDFQDLAVGETRNVTFNYTATDNSGQTNATSAVGTVTVTVTGTNDVPVVSSVAAAATEDGATVDGSFVVTDVDTTDTHTFTITSTPAEGSAVNNNDGTFTFDPGVDFQVLAVGETRNVTFNYTATDDSSTGNATSIAGTVTITVTGTNDSPVVANIATPATEDGVTNGSFAVTDADTSDTHTFTITSAPAGGSVVNNDDGTFTFDPGTDFQDLAVGETRDVTFNYIATDDSEQPNATSAVGTVTVTITGTNNNQPVVSNLTVTTTEDGATVDGSFVVTDVDTTDTHTFTITTAPAEGSVVNNNDGTFTFDPGVDFQDLAAGETRNVTFNYIATDNSGQVNDTSIAGTVTVTVTGTNDAATVSSASQILTETDVALTTNGRLTSTDVDNTDNSFTVNTIVGTIGTFEIDAIGAWSFTANSAFDNLNVGDYVNETFNVTSIDGTAGTVTIQINGTNDAATVSSDSQILTENDVALTTSGILTSTDVDNTDNSFTANTIVGTIGTFAIDGPGNWSFTANSAFDSLNAGDYVNETFKVTSVDGTASTITVTINGTNDTAVIGGTVSAMVTEDVDPDGGNLLEISGVLTISDPDVGQSSFAAGEISGTYGSLTIDTEGNWHYTANNTQSAIQQLGATTSVSDILTITTADGTTHNLVITINGANEAPVNDNTDKKAIDDGTDSDNGNDDTDDIPADDFETDPLVVKEPADEETPLTEFPADPAPTEDISPQDDTSTTSDEQSSDYLDSADQIFSPTGPSTNASNQIQKESLTGALLQELAKAKKEASDFLTTPLSAAPIYLEEVDFKGSVIENKTMLAQLDVMEHEIDQSFAEEEKKQKIAVYMTSGISVSLAAGTVSYLLRAGSLMSSFLSTIPIWKGFDPVAILVATPKKKMKKDEKTLQESMVQSDTAPDQKAENMFTEKENK